MDMHRSPRRLAGCLLLIGALAACGSPTTNETLPIVASASPPPEVPAPSSATFSEVPGTATPATSAPASSSTDQPLPLTLSRTGGIAGVQDQVKIDPDGTATVTHRAGKPTTTTLPAKQLAALRGLLADPALAREAKAVDGAGTCADGFQYNLRTPALTIKTTDCGRSKQPTLAKVITLVLPPGGK
jgi:hypothetical protein